MQIFLIVLVILCAIAAVTAVTAFKNDRKLRRRLIRDYGKVPIRKYDEYIFESISAYWDHRKSAGSPAYCVDDLTWRDLDMDSVYRRINNTSSSAGEEVLYSILHEQGCDWKDARELGRAAEAFDSQPEKRLKAQRILSRLGKVTSNGIVDFFTDPADKSLRFPALYPVLSAAAVASILSLVLGPAGFLFLILILIGNIVVYYKTKYALETKLVSLRSIAALMVCAEKLSRIDSPELKPYTARLAALIAPLRRIGKVAGAVMGSSGSDLDFLVEYIKIFFMVDFLLYQRMLSAITKHTKECMEIYRLVGFLDSAISVASFRKSLKSYVVPEFTDTDAIEMQGVVHPLLDEPVANTVTLRRSALITGSNASGKSTFVKAVAVNAILAQTIYTCLADVFCIKPSFVVTSMAVSDSLSQGESYYIAEIKSLKRILKGLNGERRCLCFIDEILKGTNTIERIAASAAVLGYLRGKNCLAVIATHDIELTEMAQDAFDNFHFQEQIGKNGITFDYTICEGRAMTKNAIRLLEFLAYPAEVTDRANAFARSFEENRVWEKMQP